MQKKEISWSMALRPCITVSLWQTMLSPMLVLPSGSQLHSNQAPKRHSQCEAAGSPEGEVKGKSKKKRDHKKWWAQQHDGVNWENIAVCMGQRNGMECLSNFDLFCLWRFAMYDHVFRQCFSQLTFQPLPNQGLPRWPHPQWPFGAPDPKVFGGPNPSAIIARCHSGISAGSYWSLGAINAFTGVDLRERHEKAFNPRIRSASFLLHNSR